MRTIRQPAVPPRSTALITMRSQSSILLLRHLWNRGGGWQPDHQAVRTAQDSFLLRKGLRDWKQHLAPGADRSSVVAVRRSPGQASSLVQEGHRRPHPGRQLLLLLWQNLLSSPAEKLTLALLNCSIQAISLESTLSLSSDFSYTLFARALARSASALFLLCLVRRTVRAPRWS